jgi:hypothetical protein
VAVEAGDIVLVRSDPRDVPRIIDLSKASYRKMIQNLAWATGYNVVAIPLAAGVLARWGVVLSPAVGAVRLKPLRLFSTLQWLPLAISHRGIVSDNGFIAINHELRFRSCSICSRCTPFVESNFQSSFRTNEANHDSTRSC